MTKDKDIRIKNLKVFSGSNEFVQLLESFGVIEKGYFEYKGLTNDGRHMRGEYFINYRLLTTEQELLLVPYYHKAFREFFGEKMKDMIIVGVAYGSLALPKTIQVLGYKQFGLEYAYAEKRDGVLGIFGAQAEKCRGKHILFIEDVCNNGTSGRQLVTAVNDLKDELQLLGYSVVYGVHRGHTFLEEPQGSIYAMSLINAPSYHPDEVPGHVSMRPFKKYKK